MTMVRLLTMLAAALFTTCAHAAAAENVLRVANYSGAVTMDPHSYFSTANRVATQQVYEALLDIDSNLAIVPQLATDWKPLDPTTWEFDLRQGVTFHNGSPFTAADVVFSIERAQANTADLSSFVGGIASVEAIDDHTVRVVITGPDPSLWLKLVNVAIMSRAWAEQRGVEMPPDYKKAREETYASRHANGTGPFMVEAFEPGGDYTLVRNPVNYWNATGYADPQVDELIDRSRPRW